jgi:SpoVK/Ycf46/Vps4 family AAA+-type ATPase
LIKIDAGNVISSTLGGSAKALTSVMDDADKNDVLLFFDEADVLLSKRSTNISQAADQEISSLKGRLLTRLDAFNGLVVFATNFPAIYDPAFRRRIIFQVPFQIPQVKELEELILFHLANAPHTVDISAAAPPTLGLSGGDVKAICIRLASQLASKRISIITTDDYIAMVTLYKSAWDFGAKSKIDTTTQTV